MNDADTIRLAAIRERASLVSAATRHDGLTDWVWADREDVPYLLALCERLEKKLAAVKTVSDEWLHGAYSARGTFKIAAAQIREALGDE